jgi:hypothetical protein
VTSRERFAWQGVLRTNIAMTD